jgi:hypothetical protein
LPRCSAEEAARTGVINTSAISAWHKLNRSITHPALQRRWQHRKTKLIRI